MPTDGPRAEVERDGPSMETPPAGADAGLDRYDLGPGPGDTGLETQTETQAETETQTETPTGACAGCAPLVHWRFDEEGGTTALDATGNGFHGTYNGDPTLPERSSSVPLTTFANPSSRNFPASGRPGVQLVNSVAVLALRPVDDLSVSAWFRATAAAGAGGDVVNVADSFLVRLKPTEIELAKRISNVAGSSYEVIQIAGSAAHLDGAWHHVVGVLSVTGIELYLDGVRRANRPAGAPLFFTRRDLWVGRRELAGTNNFQGGVDDVRVYRRALPAAEILEMAQGLR